jgi:aquaporin Z
MMRAAGARREPAKGRDESVGKEKTMSLGKRAAAEFFGTFWLVFGGCGAAVLSAAFPGLGIGFLGVALAFGLTVLTMAFAIGHISGCHLNPAVTLGLVASRRFPAAELFPYWIAQVIGAVLAAAVVYAVLGKTYALAPGAGVSPGTAVLVEGIFAFALSLVVLNVATSPETAGNSYYGLAIGFTIVAAAFCGGGISGGAFNPAVGAGPAIVSAITGMGSGLSGLWIYIVGPFLGAIIAAGVYRLQTQPSSTAAAAPGP